jgi:hypothetical protein
VEISSTSPPIVLELLAIAATALRAATW